MQEKEIQTIARVAEKLKILGHPMRLLIIGSLRSGELCVGNIAEKLDISISSASQHLRVLELNGILQSRRSGRKICYTINLPMARDICDVLCNQIARDCKTDEEFRILEGLKKHFE